MSFFHSISTFFSRTVHSSAQWTQVASTTLTLTAPLVQTIAVLVAGNESGAETTKVIQEIQRDFTTAASLIADAHSGKSGATEQLQSVLTSINTNLNGLLAAGHVKDAATLQKLTVGVNAITAEVNAILAVIPKQTASAA